MDLEPAQEVGEATYKAQAEWSKGHYLNATAGTIDYIMGGFMGFYTSKVLLQDTVNGETGGGSSAIPIATGIFSTWRAAGIMRPVHPNLHIACDPNPSCDLLPCYLLIRVTRCYGSR